jgi:hypothetical protein
VSPPDAIDFHLLGLSVVAAQRVEFLLYGLAAHSARTEAAQNDKRFRELTPDKFLDGDANSLKATLGQLVNSFGEAFLISTPDLIAFYEDRNLIVHDYARVFRMNIRDKPRREDGPEFLLNFLRRAQYWEAVLMGLLSELKQAAAVKEGREAEVVFSATELDHIQAFHENVAQHLASKLSSSDSTLV